MADDRPSCPDHPTNGVRSAASFGKRIWCCMRCGRKLGEAPLSTAPGWEEWVAEFGEEEAARRARGYRQPVTAAPAPDEDEDEDEEAPPITTPTLTPVAAPAPISAPPPARGIPKGTRSLSASRRAVVVAPSSTPAPATILDAVVHPTPARIVVTHNAGCHVDPCTCAARLRALSREAHKLAATYLKTLSNLEGYHDDDREGIRGHLQRLIVRLEKGPVC